MTEKLILITLMCMKIPHIFFNFLHFEIFRGAFAPLPPMAPSLFESILKEYLPIWKQLITRNPERTVYSGIGHMLTQEFATNHRPEGDASATHITLEVYSRVNFTLVYIIVLSVNLKGLSVIVNSRLNFFPNPQIFFAYSERTSL